MCLYIEKNFKTRQQARDFTKKPLIAKRNITVYKTLDQVTYLEKTKKTIGYSPFQSYRYEKGKTYKVKKFSFEIVSDVCYWNVKIHKGLHAFTKSNYGSHCVKMIIPRGTKYFLAKKDNEIVSQKLIWK